MDFVLELVRRRSAASYWIHGVGQQPLARACQQPDSYEKPRGFIGFHHFLSPKRQMSTFARHIPAQENQRQPKKPAKSSDEPEPAPTPPPAPIVEVDIPWEVRSKWPLQAVSDRSGSCYARPSSSWTIASPMLMLVKRRKHLRFLMSSVQKKSHGGDVGKAGLHRSCS